MADDIKTIKAIHSHFALSFFLVSRKASGEIGQNDGGQWGCRGIASFCRSIGESERSRAKILQPVVLTDLRGEGLCGKEAYLLRAFLVTFVATKVTGPPAAKSGTMLLNYNKVRYLP